MYSQPRVWFITGSSSGFGKILAELALSKGDRVVATARKPEALHDLQATAPPSQLLVCKLDVTKLEDIVTAFAAAKEAFDRIDIVYNNAGYGLLSEVEGTPDDVARAIFETNFWGAANVMREAVRFFRDVNPAPCGGRLINISSFAGVAALPCLGYYSASRHALEALTQSLSQELDPAWNIKVSLVLPGTCRTNAVDAAVRVPTHPAYDTPTSGAALTREAFRMSLENPAFKIGSAEKVCEKVYELSLMTEPPLRLILGEDSLKYVRAQVESVGEDLKKFEEWSVCVKEL